MFRRGRGKTGAAGGKRVAYGNYGYGGLDNYAGYGGVGINRGHAGNRFRRRKDDDDNFARSRRGGSKGHSGGRFVPG